jgi:hypothetical protein
MEVGFFTVLFEGAGATSLEAPDPGPIVAFFEDLLLFFFGRGWDAFGREVP